MFHSALYPSSGQYASGEMSLSKKKFSCPKTFPMLTPTHRPSPPSSSPSPSSSSSSHSASASSNGGSSNLGDSTSDNRPPSPHRLKCGAIIPNYAGSTNDSGDQTATPGYANRKGKQLPSSAPGQPHPCPTAAGRSFTKCAFAPNVSGLHGRTQQGRCAFRPRVLQPPRCQGWPDAMPMNHHW